MKLKPTAQSRRVQLKKVVSISMITAAGCEKCKEVEERITKAAQRAGVRLAIQTFDSSTGEAVELGVRYGLDDVPSFVVAGKPFCGVDFLDSAVETAMRGLK